MFSGDLRASDGVCSKKSADPQDAFSEGVGTVSRASSGELGGLTLGRFAVMVTVFIRRDRLCNSSCSLDAFYRVISVDVKDNHHLPAFANSRSSAVIRIVCIGIIECDMRLLLPME